MSKTLVMLPPGRSTFRRTMRDKAGKALRVLEFHPGKAIELTNEEVEAVRSDIGPCICIAKKVEGKAVDVFKVDGNATEAFAAGKDVKPKAVEKLKAWSASVVKEHETKGK